MPFPWFRILRLLKHSVFQIKLWTKRNVWGVLTFNHLTVEISLKNTPKSLLWPKNPKLLLFWKKTYALCRLIGIGHQHPKIDHLMRFCTSRAWNPPKTENFESVPPKTFDSNKFHNNKKKTPFKTDEIWQKSSEHDYFFLRHQCFKYPNTLL